MAGWLERSSVALVTLAQAGAAAATLAFGHTGPIPIHFDWNGQANGFADRTGVAVLVGTMAALSAFGPSVLRLLSRRRAAPDSGDLRAATPILLASTGMVTVLMVSLAFGLVGPGETTIVVIMASISAMLFVTGAYLGKLGPNTLVGVRTPWTQASRLAWDKANRLAGRLFFWIGLLGLVVAPLALQPIGLQAVVVGVLATAGLSIWESWRVWRDDPDRRAAL